MKLKETFAIRETSSPVSEWGHGDLSLKYEYKNEHTGEVKSYKMSKEELAEYLKKYRK